MPKSIIVQDDSGALRNSVAASRGEKALLTINDDGSLWLYRGGQGPGVQLLVGTATPGLSITGTPLTQIAAGVAYAFPTTVSGGTAPYTRLISGQPAGMIHDATGVSWASPAAGVSAAAISVGVRDSVGNTAFLAPFPFEVLSASATAPGAPTIGTATAGDGTVSVAFTAPASNGGSAILDYQVLLSTGQTAIGASSPISVTAPNGTPVTATVRARNAVGYGAYSAASNSVTPVAATVAPNITTPPTNQAAVVGGEATFTFAATGSPQNAEWQRYVGSTWTIISTATNLVLSGLTTDDNGAQIRVRVWNSAGSSTSPASTLTVTASTEQQKVDINGFDVIAQPPLARGVPSVLSVTLDAPAVADTQVAVFLSDEDLALGTDYFANDAGSEPWYGGSVSPNAFYDSAANKTTILYESLSPTGVARACKAVQYNHATQAWTDPVLMFTGDSALVDDNHGVPAGCIGPDGHIYAFGGSHAGTQRYASSAAAGDATAWNSLQTMNEFEFGYPHPVAVPDGIWLFLSKQASQRRVFALRKTTSVAAGVATWGAPVDFIDYGDDSRAYMYNTVRRGNEIYCLATWANGQDTQRRDLYLYIIDITTGAVRNVENTYTTSTLPISLADSRAHYLAVDQVTANRYTGALCMQVESGGNVHLAYMDGPSANANAASDLMHKVWTGAAWSAPVVVGALANRYSSMGVILAADGGVDVSWSIPGPNQTFERIGNCMIRHRSAAGVWGASSVLRWASSQNPVGCANPVYNAHANLRMVFGEQTDIETIGGTGGLGGKNAMGGHIEMYAYGDNGYVRRPYVEDAAATAAFEAMTVQPNAQRKRWISEHIRHLKTSGVWDKMGGYHILAGHDEQSSRLNYVGRRFDLIVVNTLPWGLASGYKGNASGYLPTSASPTTNASTIVMTRMSSNFGGWSLTDGALNGVEFGISSAELMGGSIRNAAGNATFRAADFDAATRPNVEGAGHFLIVRESNTVKKVFMNGLQLGATSAVATDSLPAGGLRYLSGITGPSSRHLAIGHFGSALIMNQIPALKNGMRRLLSQLGALPLRNAYKQAFVGTILAGQTTVNLGSYTPQMGGSKRVYVENDKALACDQTALMTV